MSTFYTMTELQMTRLDNLLVRWSSSVTSDTGISRVIKSGTLGPLVLLRGLSQVPATASETVVPGLVSYTGDEFASAPVASPVPFQTQRLVPQNLELSILDASGDTASSTYIPSSSGAASQEQFLAMLDHKTGNQVVP